MQQESAQQDPPYDPRPWEKLSQRRRAARNFASAAPQAKLIFCFSLMVSVTLGAAVWMFATQTRKQLTDVSGEQARQLSSQLALSCQEDFVTADIPELRALAHDLIKSRNILYVAFLNREAKLTAFASRDPDFRLDRTESAARQTLDLMQVRGRGSTVFGDYVEVVAPVLARPGGSLRPSTVATTEQGPSLIGYVAVGVSQTGEIARLHRTNYIVVGIGCVAIIVSIPLAYWLIHRIFKPIQELERVTKRIMAGDLDARVSIRRSDVIGELARAFNEMVYWVKQQRQDIAAANEKLAQANQDLERKVAQRTAQVETALTRLSSEIAEKEEFLRAVSHDLNAPLRNISGMATMLLMKHKGKFDDEVVHRLERIKTNVDVETDLIAELLELSRIKTRRQKMEPVELESLIWELRGMFESDLKGRAIDLIVDTPLPVLNAERARVRQVFQNLIDNAIKYMGEGHVREIHVGCVPRVTEAEFYVRDTGMGIEPEDLDKVFFVFRRGKNTQAQNIAGKGVGLASVKSIVETYNGKIWVESVLGAGTTFRFTINGKHVPAIGGRVAAAAGDAVAEASEGGADAEAPASASTATATATATLVSA
jgi:signal transduction histidine kinase